jgi:hypothetical protein
MREIIGVLLLVAFAAVTVWLIYREVRHRQELARKNMSFIESINLTGLPIITFKNGDTTVNMVLDTGSNVCLINQDSLKDLKYSGADEHDGVIGLEGKADKGLTVLLPLTYKDWEFEFECWATDMQATIDSLKQEYGVTIHGILGTGFFMKYRYILDFSSMVAYPNN